MWHKEMTLRDRITMCFILPPVSYVTLASYLPKSQLPHLNSRINDTKM